MVLGQSVCRLKQVRFASWVPPWDPWHPVSCWPGLGMNIAGMIFAWLLLGFWWYLDFWNLSALTFSWSLWRPVGISQKFQANAAAICLLSGLPGCVPQELSRLAGWLVGESWSQLSTKHPFWFLHSQSRPPKKIQQHSAKTCKDRPASVARVQVPVSLW